MIHSTQLLIKLNYYKLPIQSTQHQLSQTEYNPTTIKYPTSIKYKPNTPSQQQQTKKKICLSKQPPNATHLKPLATIHLFKTQNKG